MSLMIGRIGTGFSIPYSTMPMGPGRIGSAQEAEKAGPVKNVGGSTVKSAGRKSSPAECQTCSERKYKDGSDECDVSFQTPTHISPNAAGAAVRAHEQEHVANAYEKEAKGEGRVLQASVQIKTAVCPECGRTYVSGGVTHTRIAYPNENNPYQKARKSADAGALAGMNFDAAV